MSAGSWLILGLLVLWVLGLCVGPYLDSSERGTREGAHAALGAIVALVAVGGVAWYVLAGS